MCGIIGFFSKDSVLSSEKMTKALRSIRHRGPDGDGTWFSESADRALGHVRLSIIDLKSGRQPLSNEDGTITAVVNGELYDFVRIREELKGKGHRFATQSDSEILIHLYEEYGEACLEQLRGEFAFILYDKKRDLFFAARDRFGIKPIFYTQHLGSYYFASEAKALFAMGVPAQWDENMVFTALHLSTPLQNGSVFKGVRQIPPGHFLKISNHSEELKKYWDFNYPSKSALSNHPSDQELIEHFRFVLEESVRFRLHADVPVGCYLSGGLDSCSILGLAAKLSPHPVKAFTISFDKAEYDEGKIAKEMAAFAGCEFNEISVPSSDLAEHYGQAVWHAETFMINPHGIAKYLLSRAVRDAGFKVVLTGEGADEILAGYVHFRRDMILRNSENQNPEFLKTALKALFDANTVSQGLLISDKEIETNRAVEGMLGSVPSWIESFIPISQTLKGLASSDFLSRFGSRDPFSEFVSSLAISDQLSGRDAVNQALYTWSKLALPNYILSVLGDRMEMAHSIEGRVPFLDHKVVEAATRLPVSLKIRGMTEKFVLREAVKDVITPTVYKRQKHPFFAPPASMDSSSTLNALMQDTLRSRDVDSVPFLDRKKIAGVLDSLPHLSPAEQGRNDAGLNAALSAVFLSKAFGLGA